MDVKVMPDEVVEHCENTFSSLLGMRVDFRTTVLYKFGSASHNIGKLTGSTKAALQPESEGSLWADSPGTGLVAGSQPERRMFEDDEFFQLLFDKNPNPM
jgi:hypothetical protein